MHSLGTSVRVGDPAGHKSTAKASQIVNGNDATLSGRIGNNAIFRANLHCVGVVRCGLHAGHGSLCHTIEADGESSHEAGKKEELALAKSPPVTFEESHDLCCVPLAELEFS